MTQQSDAAIQSDAGSAVDDPTGVEAFLADLTAQPSEDDAPSNGEDREAPVDDNERVDDEENDAQEPDKEAEEADEEGEKPATVELADDVKLTVKVDGVDHEVTLGQLKRLAGQETALNRKSEEIAAVRKGYEAKAQEAVSVLDAMLERAKERAKPYQDIDLIRLSQQITDDGTWQALREQIKEANADVEFLTQEREKTIRTFYETKAAEQRNAAQTAVAVLSGPEDQGGIPGFSRDLYNEIVTHAVSAGLPQEVVLGITEPAAVRLLYKAMQFDKGVKQVQAKPVRTVPASPTKVAKPAATGKSAQPSRKDSAMQRLSRSGSFDDAAEAFMADLRG